MYVKAVDKVGISIHAPVKGATVLTVVPFVPYNNFNPRTREGCDDTFVKVVSWYDNISIHAPVKGATR